jgi:hypothetical protein
VTVAAVIIGALAGWASAYVGLWLTATDPEQTKPTSPPAFQPTSPRRERPDHVRCAPSRRAGGRPLP